MAHGNQAHRRVIALILAPAVLVTGLISVAAFAAKGAKPQRGVTSQESRSLPEKYARHQYRSEAAKTIRVNRDGIESLKKSSFFNRRPYQFATPVVADNMVFVGCDAGFFYAIDANKEKKIWKYKTPGSIHARAAFSDGTLFVPDTEGVVTALDAATGQKKWETVLDTEILATPLVIGPSVYVVSMSGRVYALDAATGNEQWHSGTEDRDYGFSVRRASSPIEVNGMLVLGTSKGVLKALRMSDGGTVWSTQLGNLTAQVYDVDSTPLYANGKIYAATADGGLYCVDSRTGKILWDNKAGGVNDMAIAGDRLYSSGKGSLYSVDPNSGMIGWQQDFETGEISSPAAGDGFVAVVSTRDKFSVVESTTGDIAYSRFVGKGSFGDPIVSGPYIYVLDNAGRVYGFKVRKVEPKSEKKAKHKAHAELEVEPIQIPN